MKYMIISKKQMIIFFAMLLVVSIGILAGIESISIITAAPKRKLPIYSVHTQNKVASLSFDAAWGNEDTEQLINILQKYNVKATFFVVGEWVDKYPESVKAISDAGHEIMNHSDKHPHMPELSREAMIKEITSCNDKIEQITGKRPTLFRPPYGDYNNTLIEVLESLNQYCIQWDVDSLDWKDLSAPDITTRVISKTKSGSIILFHNAAKHTPEALPSIIEQLQSNGYNLVPISAIIIKDKYTIDHTGKQYPADENLEVINNINEEKKELETVDSMYEYYEDRISE